MQRNFAGDNLQWIITGVMLNDVYENLFGRKELHFCVAVKLPKLHNFEEKLQWTKDIPEIGYI